MVTLNEIGDASFMALETFKRSGAGVVTPVWVTRDGGKLYVMTDESTWKVKRIRNNPRVRLAKSDARGTPKSAWLEAQARILEAPDAWPRMEKRMKDKYGLQYRLFNLVNRVRNRNQNYLVIEIEDGE